MELITPVVNMAFNTLLNTLYNTLYHAIVVLRVYACFVVSFNHIV